MRDSKDEKANQEKEEEDTDLQEATSSSRTLTKCSFALLLGLLKRTSTLSRPIS